MRCFLILSILLSFSFVSSAQEWTDFLEKDGVKISYRYTDCDLEMGYDEHRVLLKYENTNEVQVEFGAHFDLYYNSECATCNDPHGEYSRSIWLKPGEAKEGYCSVKCPGVLNIFVRWVDQPNQTELTDFELRHPVVLIKEK